MIHSLIILACILLMCMYWRNRNKNRNEPPVFYGAWPLIGHSLPLLRGRKMTWQFIRDFSYNLAHSNGVCRFLIGPKTVYAVCDPDVSMIIANQCIEKSNFYEFGKQWMGDSLVLAKGVIWKKDRKLLMPIFTSRTLQTFMEIFNGEARRMVEKLSAETDKGSIDHMPYMKEYTMETLCSSVLGTDFSEKSRFIDISETIIDIISKRFFNVAYHVDAIFNLTKLKKTHDECIEYTHRVADEIIKKKRQEMEGKSEQGSKKDFVTLLLDLSCGGLMTDKHIRDQLVQMIIGGYDTIAVTLPVILVMVGSHRTVQEKIWKELDGVFNGTNRDVEKEDLNKLVYLEAVMKETIRLYPAVPVVMRQVEKDTKLKNYILSAGRTCFLMLYGLGLHPIWGDDVLDFRPDRWLPPFSPPDHPAAFAAFSLGKRNCIGQYYAMMSMKTALVHVFRNFEVAADWTKMEFEQDAMSRPVSGCCIALIARNKILTLE